MNKHPIDWVLNRLEQLTEPDLYVLSEAIDLELQRRDEVYDDSLESARRRAVQREQSYRRSTGAMAPPVRVVGLGKPPRVRRAA